MINAAQIARQFNNRLSITGGLNILIKTSYEFESDDYDKSFSAPILLPQLGLKYCFWSTDLGPYIQGTIARTFASVSIEDDIEPEYEDYIHDLYDGIIGVVLSFGTEYCFNKSFTIGGETGF